MRTIVRATLAAAVLAATALFVPVARAATVQVVGGTAVFMAAPGETNDVLGGSDPTYGLGPMLTIVDTGAPLTAGPGCTAEDANTAVCPEELGAPLPLLIDTGDRNDRIREEEASLYTRAITIRSGLGDDTISAGTWSNFDPVLDGGPGDDTLSAFTNGSSSVPVMYGGTGDDSLAIAENGGGHLYGDQGNDRLSCRCFFYGPSTAARYRLDGGSGNDSYSFTSFLSGPTATSANAIVPGRGLDTLDQSGMERRAFGGITFDIATCASCVERVIGSPNADTITGDADPQVIQGGDGNDELDGGGGPDAIAGQGGDDSIAARDGALDVVGCGRGTDSVTADRFDLVSRNCETVSRAAAPRV